MSKHVTSQSTSRQPIIEELKIYYFSFAVVSYYGNITIR
ncbi:Uncharacterised protein [Plesiomonas shigelloides]|nr:Uncharacterised protein [Plesiomonas shigelloides]